MQERVFAKIDAGNNVAGTESNLLRFGEEIIRVSVERHLANHFDRHYLFRYDLGGVENVEWESGGRLFVDDLKAEFEFGKIAGGDRFV